MTSARRWNPLFVSVALLALAAGGNAQDRHSDGGRPSRSRMDRDRRSRDSDDRSIPDRGGRYNPFSRGSTHRDDAAPGNPRGRTVLGVPVRDQRPAAYDGRGIGRQDYGHAPARNALSVAIASGATYGGTNVAVGAKIGGLRVGFVSYSNPGPRVGYGFDYPFYAYDPYAPGALVVASPWYAYSYLPPYLDRSHVVVVDRYPDWDWNGWQTFDYKDDRDNPAVRDALNDLRNAFEGESGRIADRLVPEEGDIAIDNDGKYDYSLNPDDFQKMFLDGVEQSKTVHYTILEARTRGDEVRVRARHEYTDSWGQTQSVVHRITLRRENGGDYVIREFGTE